MYNKAGPALRAFAAGRIESCGTHEVIGSKMCTLSHVLASLREIPIGENGSLPNAARFV